QLPRSRRADQPPRRRGHRAARDGADGVRGNRRPRDPRPALPGAVRGHAHARAGAASGQVSIRAARADEVETLLESQREAAVVAFAHVFRQDRYPFPDDAIREAWREALADPLVEVYVADEDGDAVGSVSVGHGYLRTLYVVPAWWSKGVG